MRNYPVKIKRFQKNSAKTPCSFCAFSVDVTHSNGHFCKEKGKPHLLNIFADTRILSNNAAVQTSEASPSISQNQYFFDFGK